MPDPAGGGLSVDGDVGALTLAFVSADELADALASACDEAFGRRGLRRVTARVACDDRSSRRALHRNGFHLEGVERATLPRGTGWVDTCCYARLASDPVGDRVAFTAVMNTVTPRKRLIAHALVTDAAGRVLLCETTFKPDWELPGGIVEPLEPPAVAATREMVEEMGWAPDVHGVLVVDWLRPYLGWEDALELVFDAAVVSDANALRLVPDGHEIRALHWVDPDALEQVMTSFGAARTRSALAARAAGTTLYTEAGVPARPAGG